MVEGRGSQERILSVRKGETGKTRRQGLFAPDRDAVSNGLSGLFSTVAVLQVSVLLPKELSLPAFPLKMCWLQSSSEWLTKSIKTVPKIMNGFKGECIISRVQQISIWYFQGSELSSGNGFWQLVSGRSRSNFLVYWMNWGSAVRLAWYLCFA